MFGDEMYLYVPVPALTCKTIAVSLLSAFVSFKKNHLSTETSQLNDTILSLRGHVVC